MTRAELVELHEKMCSEARELMVRKNTDYGADADPFRNFRMFGALGILVRMSDKLARLVSLRENGKAAVESESVYDTCIDLLNYAILFIGWLKQESK